MGVVVEERRASPRNLRQGVQRQLGREMGTMAALLRAIVAVVVVVLASLDSLVAA